MRKKIMLENIDPQAVGSALLAFLISGVRVIKDRQEGRWLRKLLEALTCAMIAFTCFYAIKAMGINESWSVFTGGFVGFMGSDFVRELARKKAKNVVGEEQ